MAKSQQSRYLQPAKFISGNTQTVCSQSRNTGSSWSGIRTRVIAGLLATLVAGIVHADNISPALTNGIYLSTEQPTYLPGQIGLNLSQPALPDPASAFLKTDAMASETDVRHTFWLDDHAWITGIGTLLYHDSDRDGFHTGFSLSVDADTVRNVTDVYLSIDLRRSLFPLERLHTSRNFTLYGNSLTDEYQIDIDLLQNYPAGYYDLSIELHDAYDNRILDRVTAADFSNLSRLPLESEDQDSIYDTIYPEPHFPPANDDIYVQEYAGSAGLLTTLCLSLSLWTRRRERIRTKSPQHCHRAR
jgi:hypothetical protein